MKNAKLWPDSIIRNTPQQEEFSQDFSYELTAVCEMDVRSRAEYAMLTEAPWIPDQCLATQHRDQLLQIVMVTIIKLCVRRNMR